MLCIAVITAVARLTNAATPSKSPIYRPFKAQGGGIATRYWRGRRARADFYYDNSSPACRLYSSRPAQRLPALLRTAGTSGNTNIIFNLQFIPGWNRAVVLVHFL